MNFYAAATHAASPINRAVSSPSSSSTSSSSSSTFSTFLSPQRKVPPPNLRQRSDEIIRSKNTEAVIKPRRYSFNDNSLKKRRSTVCAGKRLVFSPMPPSDPNLHSKLKSDSSLEVDMINLNCSGEWFQINRVLLSNYPRTLLGSSDIERFYKPEMKCYFFDRNRQFFEHIIQFYMCGVLNIPQDFDWGVAVTELKYFKLSCDDSISSSDNNDSDDENGMEHIMSARNWWEKCRVGLFRLLNYPRMSILSCLYCITDIIMVVVSMVFMMLETDKKLFPDIDTEGTLSHYIIHIGDKIFMTFFTFDFIIRLISWPNYKDCTYFREPTNILDIIALCPYYIEHVLRLSDVSKNINIVAILRAMRLLRMVRIFRFIRHSHDLFQIIRFVFETREQLAIIYLFSNIVILLFGSVMYYAEGGPQFNSVLSACWWSLVTLSTLGYGDQFPKTLPGCIVGSLAVMVGMVILSLPMTIVVSKFAEWFEVQRIETQHQRRQLKYQKHRESME